MKETIISTLLILVAMNMSAQTKADSLRADSIFKSLELQGVAMILRTTPIRSRTP